MDAATPPPPYVLRELRSASVDGAIIAGLVENGCAEDEARAVCGLGRVFVLAEPGSAADQPPLAVVVTVEADARSTTELPLFVVRHRSEAVAAEALADILDALRSTGTWRVVASSGHPSGAPEAVLQAAGFRRSASGAAMFVLDL